MTLLAVESVRSTAHLAANATTLPVWTTVSRAFAVEVMLADAPLASLGLVGFALGACWTVIGGLGRTELCIVLATLFAFLSAVCDLSQVLILRAPNRTVAPLVVVAQLFLAVSNALRFGFLHFVTSRCPSREAWARELAAAERDSSVTVERKGLTSGCDDNEDKTQSSESWPAEHSGEWRSWLGESHGRAGQATVWTLIVAIMTLSCAWRITYLTSFQKASAFYTADVALQMALSVILTLKMFATVHLTTRTTEKSLVGCLGEFSGPAIGLALGFPSTVRVWPLFSETPVGRFLCVADLYVLGVAHLLVTFRARDVNTVPIKALVHLAALRAASEPFGGASTGLGQAVPRHPSPAKRVSGGLCNWLRREAPHLIASPSSVSLAESDSVAVVPPGMNDVEVGLTGSGSDDFRFPRSALGRDIGMPLMAGLGGRHFRQTARLAPRLKIRTDLDNPAFRLAATGLGSNGTFRPLDTTLGAVRITNASADDFSSSSVSPSDSSADETNVKPWTFTPLSSQRLSQIRLPRLPSVSTPRGGAGSVGRGSEDDGEHLIYGGRSSQNGISEPAPVVRGSGLSLPPLAALLQPPPPAFRPARLYVPSSLRTASIPTQSICSKHSSSSTDEASDRSVATRDILPQSSTLVPRPLAVVRVSQQSSLRRSSTRASFASGKSSNDISSFSLDSFPVPPPEQVLKPVAQVTGVPQIGPAVGGVNLAPRRSSTADASMQRMSSLQPPIRRTGDDDVDVTSFIAGPRASSRNSAATTNLPRLRASVRSVASGPAAILQAEVLIRHPPLDAVLTSPSRPLGRVASRGCGLDHSSDESQPTPATVHAVPAIECLHRLECAIDRSQGTLTDATASIPAVILQDALPRHLSPLRGQAQPKTPSKDFSDFDRP